SRSRNLAPGQRRSGLVCSGRTDAAAWAAASEFRSAGISGRKSIVARPPPVYERDGQVRADTLHVTVSPYFEWIRLGPTTTEKRFDLVRRAVHNVHAAAIGLPARPAGDPIAFVGIGDPAIMFLFGLVFDRAWRRIAPEPELLDEFPPLLVSSQFLERS